MRRDDDENLIFGVVLAGIAGQGPEDAAEKRKAAQAALLIARNAADDDGGIAVLKTHGAGVLLV